MKMHNIYLAYIKQGLNGNKLFNSKDAINIDGLVESKLGEITLLHYTVINNDADGITFILKQGANINIKDKLGWAHYI